MNLLLAADDAYGLDEQMRAAGISAPYGYSKNAEAREAFRMGYNAGIKTGASAAAERFEAVISSKKISTDAQLRSALHLVFASSMSAEDAIDFTVKAHANAGAQRRTVPTIEERMNGQGALLALGGPIGGPIESAPAKSIFTPQGAAEVYARRRERAGGVD